MQQVDDRIVAMYRQIREILAKYRSGKIPKAFKVIPALRNWEQVSSAFRVIRDCMSLITGRGGGGGATIRERGACEVLPLRKRGAENVLAMLKGGHKYHKFCGSFLRSCLKF